MSPSKIATQQQFEDPNYPGVDNWQDCSLHKGNVVYIWEVDDQTNHGCGDAYAMTPDTALSCGGDPNKLQDALQTNIDPRFDSHRSHLQAYKINETTPAAFSHCEANKCHGAGGGEQYYIPDFDNKVQNGQIQKVDSLNLDFNKEALPISAEQKADHTLALKSQVPEQSPVPSKWTQPTLDGAYKGSTPEKVASLKPKIDVARNEWQSKTVVQAKSNKIGNSVDITSKSVASKTGGGANAPNRKNGTLPDKNSSQSVEQTSLNNCGRKPDATQTKKAAPDNTLSGTTPGKPATEKFDPKIETNIKGTEKAAKTAEDASKAAQEATKATEKTITSGIPM